MWPEPRVQVPSVTNREQIIVFEDLLPDAYTFVLVILLK